MKNIKTQLIIFLAAVLILTGCNTQNQYVLNETSFFLVMTNMQYYPEQYKDATIEYDCFTYALTDVSGNEYICGVRKCSSGYGCTCGNDTIIGFILEYDGKIPEPKNQSSDSADKTWVHLKGKIKSSNKKAISIYAYKDGKPDYQTTETLLFLTFVVESCDQIEDYSNLNYYVTK